LRIITVASGGGEQTRNLAGTGSVGSATGAGLVQTQRAVAAGQGIKVNGLTIGMNNLANYHTASVQTTDGFVVLSDNFDTFEAAVLQKIVSKTHAIPEPRLFLVWGVLDLAIVGLINCVR